MSSATYFSRHFFETLVLLPNIRDQYLVFFKMYLVIFKMYIVFFKMYLVFFKMFLGTFLQKRSKAKTWNKNYGFVTSLKSGTTPVLYGYSIQTLSNFFMM